MNIESGIYRGTRQLADLTSKGLIDQVALSKSELASFGPPMTMHPDSPHTFIYDWLGYQSDFDALSVVDVLTRYTVLPT